MSKERQRERKRGGREGGREGWREKEEGWGKKKRKSDETERTLSMGFRGVIFRKSGPWLPPSETHTHTQPGTHACSETWGCLGDRESVSQGKRIHHVHQNRNFVYYGLRHGLQRRHIQGEKKRN